MTLAADARAAARAHPFLYAALRAGVVNHTAAARFLGAEEDDVEAVAVALRRYADELSARDPPGDPGARVEMHSGLGRIGNEDAEGEGDPGEPLLAVGGAALAPSGGDLTALLAHGDLGPRTLGAVLARLDAEGVDVRAAGATASRSENGNGDGDGGRLLVAVPRRDGVDALRAVEETVTGGRSASGSG